MKQKSSFLFNLVITGVLGLFASPVRADFICSAEIAYKWERRGIEAREDDAIPSKDNKNGLATPPVSVTPEPAQAPSQVRYATVERGGNDEVTARTLLGVELGRQKARASDRCKREHESFGECLATKLSVKGSVLNSLSFAARTQLERALTEECQGQQGTCLSVESTEPVCREVVKVEKSGKGPAVEVSSGADAKKSEGSAAKGAEPAAAGKSDAKGDGKGKAGGAKK